jgi:hypothetical protein
VLKQCGLAYETCKNISGLKKLLRLLMRILVGKDMFRT